MPTKELAQVLEAARYTGSGTRWGDIIGLEHARREVTAVMALLKQPELARTVGAELTPLLFVGPAGVGKTLLARAMSVDLGLPMYTWASSELTAPLIRQVFRGLATERCLIFIDEIDYIGQDRHRGGHSDRSKQGLVQLCAEMDGISVLDGPLVVGATAVNPLFLDDSLLRSGRFSTKIGFDRPNRAERLRLFELYAARVTAIEPLDFEEAAQRSQGVTGADVRAVLNAGLALALADGFAGLTSAHLFEALERRGYVRDAEDIDPLDQWRNAVHESGHVFAAFALFGPSALNRVTIIPRQSGPFLAGGHFEFDEDWSEGNVQSTANWRHLAMVAFAGAVAEELLLGYRRLGEGDDAYKATGFIVDQILAGADPDYSPASPRRIEANGPYGSEAMRSRMWNVADRHGHELIARTRTLLGLQREAMARFAQVLLRERVLSGDRLIEELRGAEAVEAPTTLPA